MELFGFLPKGSSLLSCFWRRSRDHAKPILGLTRFFAAQTDFMTKILLTLGVVRLAVICANARCSLDQLSDQRRRHRMAWNLQCKVDNAFRKRGRPLF